MPTVLLAHPSPDLYGSDRVLLETVSAFIEDGSRVVVALPEEGPLVAALEERGAEVEFCPSPVLRKSYLHGFGLVRLVAEALAALPRSLRLVRRLRPRLILVNTVTIPLWILVARSLGVPVVCHVHEAEQSVIRLVRRLLYLPLLGASGLVVNSRFSLDVLLSAWPSLGRRAEVVYNGVPGPADASPPRPRLDGDVRLLFIGRLSPRKGPQVAIDALAALLRDGTQVRLQLLGAIFPGYEWFEAQLHAQVADLGVGDQVEFIGFDPDIWSRLAAADIVIVPSTVDEPFGNTAVEAMLAQRPLVVSATSGLREASAGYLTARQVRPGEPEDVRRAVLGLMEDWTEVTALSDQDRTLALDRHAPPVYRRRLVEVVAGLAHRSSRRGPPTP
jgi:glycosyltransferase involved in cell wall biosynthesis